MRLLAALASAALAAGPAFAQAAAGPAAEAPYVATPDAVVDAMLELAGTGPADYVVDLGSGDGRIVIRAVTHHRARGGFGVEIDPDLVRVANRNAAAAGVGGRVRFVAADLFATDVSAATVVTVYLLPAMMERVGRKLRRELAPGSRIVAHDFPFPNWDPEHSIDVESNDKLRVTGFTAARLYLYRVPPRREAP